jgi:hypothetical protein
MIKVHKYLPLEMREWYFPFNWDVKELWKQDGKIESRNVKDLEWHLRQPFWSSQRGKGLLFDLKPTCVLLDPIQSPYHMARIQDADLNYPICLTGYQGREIIIDGIHRLAKAFSQNADTITVKVISEKAITLIAKYG